MPLPPEVLLSVFGEETPQTAMMDQAQKRISDTGEALKGPGGPKDDMIPAQIVNPETGEPMAPAALSPGEFVIKQAAVAYLGDGDENAGAAYLDVLQTVPEALDEVRTILAKYLL